MFINYKLTQTSMFIPDNTDGGFSRHVFVKAMLKIISFDLNNSANISIMNFSSFGQKYSVFNCQKITILKALLGLLHLK